MPSRDRLYPAPTARVNRQEMLQLAVLAGTRLAGMLLLGCGTGISRLTYLWWAAIVPLTWIQVSAANRTSTLSGGAPESRGG